MTDKTLTVRELRTALWEITHLGRTDWLDVTVVTPDGHHHNIARVEIGSDDEGQEVVTIEFDD